jgi:hypothetical protein
LGLFDGSLPLDAPRADADGAKGTDSRDGPAAAGQLDLELWNPGAAAVEHRFAVRITNRGDTPVALGQIAVKVWFDHGGADPLEAASDKESLSVYAPAGTWRRNLEPTKVAFATVTPARDCGGGRRASRVAAVTFAQEDAGFELEPGGGYVACNHDQNAMTTWHRTDWATLDRSKDYSRIADAGTGQATRSNLRQFTLYLDGELVTEQLDAATADPDTGVEPCP